MFVCVSFIDMSQFGLGSTNSHWGYSSAGYSPYLTSSGLSSCGTTTAASQFNNPALGFTCSPVDQNGTQDFTGSTRECLPSKFLLCTKRILNRIEGIAETNITAEN